MSYESFNTFKENCVSPQRGLVIKCLEKPAFTDSISP